MAPDRSHHDSGAAPAEFALVGGLLVVVFLAVVQLAVAVHVRNTLIASAADGARVAAMADQRLADGVAETRAAIARSLSPSYARDVLAQRVVVDGLALVEVEVRAPLPVVGLVGPGGAMVVRAHAVLETP